MGLDFNSEGLPEYVGPTVSVSSGAVEVEPRVPCPLCGLPLRLEDGRLPGHTVLPKVHCIASGKVWEATDAS